MSRRRAGDICFISLCLAFAAAALSLLFIILGYIIWRGVPAITPGFLTEGARDFGAAGGVFYQISGTILLMVTAGLISLPVALGTALFNHEYMRPSYKKTTDLFIYALSGVPTIIFGLLGYILIGGVLHLGVSWVTGSIILAIMILPTMTLSIDEALCAMPLKYREAALALGLGRWHLIRALLLPRTIPGLLTGLFLGLARAAGETAAIMFTATAFSGVGLPRSLSEPVATLQTHILVLAGEATNPRALTNAWGAALILVTLVLILSLSAMFARRRVQMEAEK
ncbi:MAG: phosphate ABC transporter permease PstA [Thermodesulfobacteriota bacterium]